MGTRPATPEDVPAMLSLAAQKRAEYERYAPTFWRRAADAEEKQKPFFESLLQKPNVIALVYESDGEICGFVIAWITSAPPVYNPGGKVCSIDDFTVADSDDWPSVGAALLGEAGAWAKAQGAVLSVVVCGHLDEPKRQMLREQGFVVASEWYVNPL